MFEEKTTPKSTGVSKGEYLTHPAFTFGTEELAGIWVGKFELTGDTTTPTVKPGSTSLRSQNVNTFWNTIRKMNNSNYGLTTADAHMIKNMEWGAMAYLSHSKYGIGEEVRLNNNKEYKTGCGASQVPTTGYGTYEGTTDCEIVYGSSATNQPQSTTGNIYGIYDTSGGSHEYVMGVNDLGNSGNSDSSGIPTGLLSKYYDDYAYGTTYNDVAAYERRKLGDATSETRQWYSDYASFVSSVFPWDNRGGAWFYGDRNGIFYFICANGGINAAITTRSVLIP